MLQELRPEDPALIGPYRLVGRLGDGGMGRVYLGLSAGGRRVAVKVIRAELATDPDFRLRFRQEVDAARKVSGLFTATVADADTDAPQPWLATAYVSGPSLAEAVREHGPLPPGSVLTLAAGLAESLVAIHGAGVVHRDLKPSNVLLGEDGPCVIDFGISRATEATSLTRTGFVMGSPGFMSPEQAEGDHVGPPSDIFSLGTVLAFAASGEPPFGNGSSAALVYRVVHSPARLGGVPEQIRPLIGRCLVKDPSQRPNATDLLAGIGAIRPMTGWLPESVAGAMPQRPAPNRPAPDRPAPDRPAPERPAPDRPTQARPAPERSALDRPTQARPTPDRTPARPAPAHLTPAHAAPAHPAPAQSAPTYPAPAHPAPAQSAPTYPAPAHLAPTHPAPDHPAQGHPTSARAALPGVRRPRFPRPLILGAAAASILIAATATWLATAGGQGRQMAGSGAKDAVTMVTSPDVTTSAQPVGSRARRSAGRGAQHARTSSSEGPGTQPATPDAITSAPPTRPASTPSSRPANTQAYSFSYNGASKYSCAVEGSVSSSSGATVQFSFIDDSPADVEIASVDANGVVAPSAVIGQGGSLTVSTNAGDYWVLEKSAGGGCLAVFMIDGAGQIVVG